MKSFAILFRLAGKGASLDRSLHSPGNGPHLE
jgi:hypothetical protein